MATATIQPTKLTLKQSFLVNLLRGMYFVWGPWMSADDPRRKEIHELLDKADRIAGDERAILVRKVSTLSPELKINDLYCLSEYVEDMINTRELAGGYDGPREV